MLDTMPPKAAMTPDDFRALLERKDLTQREAAERLGVSLNTVHRWVNGGTRITVASAALIREKLGTK